MSEINKAAETEAVDNKGKKAKKKVKKIAAETTIVIVSIILFHLLPLTNKMTAPLKPRMMLITVPFLELVRATQTTKIKPMTKKSGEIFFFNAMQSGAAIHIHN